MKGHCGRCGEYGAVKTYKFCSRHQPLIMPWEGKKKKRKSSLKKAGKHLRSL